jgi:hypothetical protein
VPLASRLKMERARNSEDERMQYGCVHRSFAVSREFVVRDFLCILARW